MAKQMGKKGQYHILLEMMLVILGILITVYTISLFTDVRTGATKVAVQDNFDLVAEEIATGVIKVSAAENATHRIQIPDKIADASYKIRLDDNSVIVMNLVDNTVNVTKEIFNIGQVNRIITSEVASASLIVEIVSEDGNIRIRRGNWTT